MNQLGKQPKLLGLREQGQSLVEMSLVVPLLLLLFLGVFEVGWALRGYLILANVNREATRIAVKSGTLDFSSKTIPITSTVGATINYDAVVSHTLSGVGFQPGIPLDDPSQNPTLALKLIGGSPNATMIISHFIIDVVEPCDDIAICDCSIDDPNHAQWFPEDDLIIHPNTPSFGHYSETYGISQTTRINYPAVVEELTLQNNQLNCA
ncbi:MAG: TadE/TadG family type IV pilus assembly protein, partial [Anaerolineae bacterium]|nr:TadE/TadG family type IV pilus assembly protein [Anaerolineae bacterium]